MKGWYVIVMSSVASLYCSQGPQESQEQVILLLQAKIESLQQENAQLREIVKTHGIPLEERVGEASCLKTMIQQSSHCSGGTWHQREQDAERFLTEHPGLLEEHLAKQQN